MKKDESFKIGFILKPHGLKGEVSVSLDDTAPEDISEIKTLFLEINQALVPYFIERASASGAKAFIKFEDVDTADEAQQISKCSLFLPKASRPKSTRGEFYSDEVIDFQVVTVEDVVLGKIHEIVDAGPNKLLVLDHQGKEVMIPVNAPFIKSVNKSKKRITVELPEGFLDI